MSEFHGVGASLSYRPILKTPIQHFNILPPCINGEVIHLKDAVIINIFELTGNVEQKWSHTEGESPLGRKIRLGKNFNSEQCLTNQLLAHTILYNSSLYF